MKSQTRCCWFRFFLSRCSQYIYEHTRDVCERTKKKTTACRCRWVCAKVRYILMFQSPWLNTFLPLFRWHVLWRSCALRFLHRCQFFWFFFVSDACCCCQFFFYFLTIMLFTTIADHSGLPASVCVCVHARWYNNDDNLITQQIQICLISNHSK